MTSGKKFIPEIDGLRFVAIVPVILFHILKQMERYYAAFIAQVPEFLRNLIHNGDRGVRLFFVISGFVLALPFARHHLEGAKPVSLKRYFLRRLTRLEPPYLLSLALLFALIIVSKGIPWRSLLPHLLASSIYLHNLIFSERSTISPVTWSLEVEIQFYILVPVLTAVFMLRNTMKRRAVLAVAIVLIGLAQTIFPPPEDGRVIISIIYYIQFFLTGFLLADLYILTNKSERSLIWDFLGGVACVALFLVPDTSIQLTGPVLLLTFTWSALKGPNMGTLFRHVTIVTIGGMCYSLYLVHFSLIALATKLAGRHPVDMIAASLLLVGVIGTLYFVLIERPCMNPNWPSDLMRKLRAKRPGNPSHSDLLDREVPLG